MFWPIFRLKNIHDSLNPGRSRVERRGPRAPKRYIFLTMIFRILIMSIKQIFMFPLAIIVPCGSNGGHLGFSAGSRGIGKIG